MDHRHDPHLYKLYGYGLCKGKPDPKIAEHKVQETLHFRYLKFLLPKAIALSLYHPWDERYISLH